MSIQKWGDNKLMKISINDKEFVFREFDFAEFLELAFISTEAINSASQYMNYEEDLAEGDSIPEGEPKGEFLTEIQGFLKSGKNVITIEIENEEEMTTSEFWDILNQRPDEEHDSGKFYPPAL